jgi:hypothetical protein
VLGLAGVGGLVVLAVAGVSGATAVLVTAVAIVAMIALGNILGGRTTPNRAPHDGGGDEDNSGAEVADPADPGEADRRGTMER